MSVQHHSPDVSMHDVCWVLLQAKHWSSLRGLVPMLVPAAPVRTEYRLYPQVHAAHAADAADVDVAAASTQHHEPSANASAVVSVSRPARHSCSILWSCACWCK